MIASRKTLEAAVVDAASDTERYDTVLRERGFRLHFVIDTHIDADHVSGARRLAAAHGAELCVQGPANGVPVSRTPSLIDRTDSGAVMRVLSGW